MRRVSRSLAFAQESLKRTAAQAELQSRVFMPRRGYLIAIAFFEIVVIVGLALLIRFDYRNTEHQWHLELQSYASLVRRSVDASLTIADLKMTPLLGQLSLLLQFGQDQAVYSLDREMRGVVRDIDQIDSLLLIGTDGKVFWSTVPAIVGVDLSDRQYFQSAMSDSDALHLIGAPVISRGTGRTVVPIAWPIQTNSGEVVAIAASSLGEDYFIELLQSVEVGEEIRLRLLTQTGEVAFSSHDVAEDAAFTETFSVSSGSDPSAFEVIASLPATLALSEFRNRTIGFVGLASILILGIFVIGNVVRRRTIELEENLRILARDRQKIAEARSEFEAIFQNVNDGIAVLSADERRQRVNPKANEFFGTNDPKVTINALREIIEKEIQFTPEFGPTDAMIEVGEQGDADYRALRLGVTQGQRGDGTIYAVIGDYTEEVKLMSERQAFVATINHELRTPLTSLKGSLELLQARYKDQLSEKAAKLIAMAAQNAERLLLLVNDVLTVQAIDGGRLTIHPEVQPVGDILSEAKSANTGMASARSVRLEIEDGTEPSACLSADKLRIQQILSNVISNALKYSPTGGQVIVGAEQQGDTVVIEVSDEGPGIPEGALESIFQRFAPPAHGSNVQIAGTGLGLSITRELVERMDGTIRITNRYDTDGNRCGARVTLSFPLVVETAELDTAQ